MRIGRIAYVNCFPVYGAIDRGIVPLRGDLVTGVPSELNEKMRSGMLDVSVVSAVEYARDSRRYVLLPDLAISSQRAVRSVLLFSKRPASELTGRRVVLSRSSMTSVYLTELLFDSVWRSRPEFIAGEAELANVDTFGTEDHEARLVIGDAALLLQAREASGRAPLYPFVYDLGTEWRTWTGLPFVFAVWVAQRSVDVADSLGVHASLIASRNWGLAHLRELAHQAAAQTGLSEETCRDYFRGLDYGFGIEYLAGLTEFFGRLASSGRVPATTLTFLAA